MASTRELLAAARKRWGKTAFVRENPRAMKPAQRQQRRDLIAQLKQQEEETSKAIAAMKHDWQALLRAAEFWRDVSGQEPSTQQLLAAILAARHYVDLCDERTAVKAEREKARDGMHTYRWEAGYIGGIDHGFQYASVNSQADTSDELLALIRGKSKEASTA